MGEVHPSLWRWRELLSLYEGELRWCSASERPGLFRKKHYLRHSQRSRRTGRP